MDAIDIVAAWQAVLEPHRDPARAEAMAAYMKHHFAFLGVATSERRRLVNEVNRTLGAPDETTLHAVATLAWELPEREYQYAATDYMCRHISRASADLTLPLLERLITTKSWWDTVDVLCRHGAGELVRREPSTRPLMETWLESGDLWLVRSAILHQERWKSEMEWHWLRHASLRHADHRDFFVRKAIGWALRTYAHGSPEQAGQVRSLLDEAPFSGLTRREALLRVRH